MSCTESSVCSLTSPALRAKEELCDNSTANEGNFLYRQIALWQLLISADIEEVQKEVTHVKNNSARLHPASEEAGFPRGSDKKKQKLEICSMTVPSLPAFFNFNYTDKDGRMTSDAYLYNDQMFQVLNSVITSNGIVFPSFAVAPVGAKIGSTWYNSTIDKLQFQGASAVQTITSV